MRGIVVAAALLVPALAWAKPEPLPPGTTWKPLCPDHSCRAQVPVDADGNVLHFTTPHGYEPADLQMMFDIDPTRGAGTTVAVVDAYGYQELEADLTVYRSQFGLPPCSVASGCLTILNSDGQPSPLDPDSDPMWIVESALDVDMVSAACPMCKIVAIQAEGAGLEGLQVGQLVAASMNVDAISDSWGGPEDSTVASNEGDYNNAGIATFVSSGDDGFDGGPSYPTTSAFTISVGGVGYDGTTFSAWAGAGSACSAWIPLQPWSPVSAPCTKRASADIAAFANPLPGVAIYALGSWQPVGGTSAAAPMSAAIFAAAGHADARPGFVYKHPDAFVDITAGTSGSCGSTLCNAALGWDGPTGLGIPDQAKLAAIGGVAGAGPNIQISYPTDGATVQPGFTIEVTPDDATLWTQIQIDGANFTRLGTPWMTTAPNTIATGDHMLTFISYDIDHNSQTTSIGVTVATDDMQMPAGCCSTSGSPGAGALFVAGVLVMRRRRRRATR
jgi:uncharacterized protein (TIGR03382 family)